MERTEAIELRTVTRFVRGTPVHEFQVREWRGLPVLGTPSDAPVQLVAGPESKPGHDLAANIDIVFAGYVARLSTPHKSRAAGENLQHTQPVVVGHVTAIERLIWEKPKTENFAPTGTHGGTEGSGNYCDSTPYIGCLRGTREARSFALKEPMMPESSPGPSSPSEPAVGGPTPNTEDHGSRVGWLGSLFLLLAPFAFFAALLALDGLLP